MFSFIFKFVCRAVAGVITAAFLFSLTLFLPMDAFEAGWISLIAILLGLVLPFCMWGDEVIRRRRDERKTQKSNADLLAQWRQMVVENEG